MDRMTLTAEALAAALPWLEGTLRLAGLQSPVEVWRDRWGIPHVRAGSVHDAFFAQGFVHAQDRLWQMDADRQRGLGRWATVAGPPGLEQDLLMRRFRLEASARADLERGVDPETRAVLEAYAAGVNAFMEWALANDRLPVEFRLLGTRPARWEPWHCLVVYKMRHIHMGVWAAKDWRARLVNRIGPDLAAKLLPGYVPGQPLILPPGAVYAGLPLDGLAELRRGSPIVGRVRSLGGSDLPRLSDGYAQGGTDVGSNNWALSGKRTASGRPLLAGDPHRALDTPNVYYQNHLACPEFDAVGLSFAGVPGLPHFGHNSSVAWCVTHAMADYQDLYVEWFDPENPGRYRYMEGWLDAERFPETIEVRGAPSVELEVTVTHHGPVILGDPRDGHAVACRYTATAEPNTGFNALLPMLRATTAAELEESMRPWVDPANNLVFADTEGNIGYRTRGKIPLRSAANAWLPVPGWTGEHEWRGVIPFEEMPALHNPPNGFIVTANNRIVDERYPHYLALDFAPSFRAQRILDLLESAAGRTVEDMAVIHADLVSIPGNTFARLVDLIEPRDEASAWARETLRAWDGTMDGASTAPLIYSALREQLLYDLMAPLLGSLAPLALGVAGPGGPTHMARLRAALVDLITDDDRTLLPEGTAWPDAMRVALERVMVRLQDCLGKDRAQWHWDRLHRTGPVHQLSPVFPELAPLLNPPSVGMSGDSDTVAAAASAPAGEFILTSTSVARYVFDLADWDRSGWVVPLGASGHPGSPHYADQVGPWSKYRLLPMLFSWDRIRAEAESHQVLDRCGGARLARGPE